MKPPKNLNFDFGFLALERFEVECLPAFANQEKKTGNKN
jgi:hypothetical protein